MYVRNYVEGGQSRRETEAEVIAEEAGAEREREILTSSGGEKRGKIRQGKKRTTIRRQGSLLCFRRVTTKQNCRQPKQLYVHLCMHPSYIIAAASLHGPSFACFCHSTMEYCFAYCQRNGSNLFH